MKLRRLLEDLSSIRGLTSEEKGDVQLYLANVVFEIKASYRVVHTIRLGVGLTLIGLFRHFA